MLLQFHYFYRFQGETCWISSRKMLYYWIIWYTARTTISATVLHAVLNQTTNILQNWRHYSNFTQFYGWLFKRCVQTRQELIANWIEFSKTVTELFESGDYTRYVFSDYRVDILETWKLYKNFIWARRLTRRKCTYNVEEYSVKLKRNY